MSPAQRRRYYEEIEGIPAVRKAIDNYCSKEEEDTNCDDFGIRIGY